MQINGLRFLSDFNALDPIGGTAHGGVTRPTFSPTHLEARNWYAVQVQCAGLELQVDGAGNHSAVLHCPNPSAPILLLGSHLDSVLDGGMCDDALGVKAALEARVSTVLTSCCPQRCAWLVQSRLTDAASVQKP